MPLRAVLSVGQSRNRSAAVRINALRNRRVSIIRHYESRRQRNYNVAQRVNKSDRARITHQVSPLQSSLCYRKKKIYVCQPRCVLSYFIHKSNQRLRAFVEFKLGLKSKKIVTNGIVLLLLKKYKMLIIVDFFICGIKINAPT